MWRANCGFHISYENQEFALGSRKSQKMVREFVKAFFSVREFVKMKNYVREFVNRPPAGGASIRFVKKESIELYIQEW